MPRVSVRQPSGATFDVTLTTPNGQLQRLKAAIAQRIHVATSRQKLFLGTEPLSDEILAAHADLEVLLLVSRCCTLLSHTFSGPPAVVWDADVRTLLCPKLLLDGVEFQHPYDAMYLDDGELYTLVKAGNLNPEVYRLEVWRGTDDASCVRRFELPTQWLNESCCARFSPDGHFVVVYSMGQILMWRTLTGEAYLTAEGNDWSGSIMSMSLRHMVLAQDRSIDVWDYHKRQIKRNLLKFKGLFDGADHALESPSGDFVAIWSFAQALLIHSVEDGIRWAADKDLSVTNLAFSPDESEIVLQYQQNPLELRIVRFLAADSAELVVQVPAQSSPYFSTLEFSCSGEVLVLGHAGGILLRWQRHADGFAPLPAVKAPPPEVDTMTSGVALDMASFFRCFRDGAVEIFDLVSGDVLASTVGHVATGGYQA